MRDMRIQIAGLDLPAIHEVCPECDGHGTQLCEGMRGHAYTFEEFQESFDADEQAEYFRRGGRYDVECEECQGKRVIAVVDRERCTQEQLALLEKWEHDARCDRWEREAERRMGC